MNDDDAIGGVAPPRGYNTNPDGRETIDRIRETIGLALDVGFDRGLAAPDAAFYAYCRGQALKYRDRLGKEGRSPNDDHAKMTWYEDMAMHLLQPDTHPDPRAYRSP